MRWACRFLSLRYQMPQSLHGKMSSGGRGHKHVQPDVRRHLRPKWPPSILTVDHGGRQDGRHAGLLRQQLDVGVQRRRVERLLPQRGRGGARGGRGGCQQRLAGRQLPAHLAEQRATWGGTPSVTCGGGQAWGGGVTCGHPPRLETLQLAAAASRVSGSRPIQQSGSSHATLSLAPCGHTGASPWLRTRTHNQRDTGGGAP